MTGLAGRHALISGGGSGVGEAIALKLAEAGARVTIIGRRAEVVEATAARHGNMRWHSCDVTDEAGVNAVFRDAVAAHGPVDIAVANAGAAVSMAFAKMTAVDFRDMLEANLVGTFNVFRAALENMREAEHGRMIAIASTAGLKGYPYVAGYCAAKHGVVGLVHALALELARTSITVNAICPGFTDTPMLENSIAAIVRKTGRTRDEIADELRKSNPQRRFIQPGEIADTVYYLCGTGAASITGQALSISGGEI